MDIGNLVAGEPAEAVIEEDGIDVGLCIVGQIRERGGVHLAGLIIVLIESDAQRLAGGVGGAASRDIKSRRVVEEDLLGINRVRIRQRKVDGDILGVAVVDRALTENDILGIVLLECSGRGEIDISAVKRGSGLEGEIMQIVMDIDIAALVRVMEVDLQT